ncbi:MAG: 2-succinyl-5-enolpyruvyl-6-hydroxy-3-cyclohexene-1-carboxylic-acid synthase [Dysgonomonas sp.]
MYSVKKNVQLLVASIKSYGIRHIILSPGSRNAPLIHTFKQHPFFDCHLVIDERSAAYHALGIIQKERKPVVICCTSGTALLNYAPAIAEAYYQQLPLIVISADRSPAWIGQMDGQTIPQNNILSAITKKSVQLPEINTDEENWFCQRLIHDAILSSTKRGWGPVHINVPISEPLFNFSASELPEIKPIRNEVSRRINISDYYSDRWQQFSKRMIVIGQLEQNNNIGSLVDKLAERFDCVVLAEHIANINSPYTIWNFDPLLHRLSVEEQNTFKPDLLISIGGHIVSKRLKFFLRQNKASEHWHISENGNLVDLFQSLTDFIEVDPSLFFEDILKLDLPSDEERSYSNIWKRKSEHIPIPANKSGFSDLLVVHSFMNVLPSYSALHLANSSSVRNVQLYPLDSSIEVFCNRGTNGIEGSLSTAIGFARQSDNLVFLLIGDLSFFYDLNSLCYQNPPGNLRILLINNGGGAIFHQLPIPQETDIFSRYIAAENSERASKWIVNEDIEYLSAQNEEELKLNISKFISKEQNKPIILEVFTSIEDSKIGLEEYYNQLKQ